jgi:hypothetical protein
VEGFSAEWLSLREPADHTARSARLTRAVAESVDADPAPRILDLAAGTGSFPGARWLLVDHDPALLARVTQTPRLETRVTDLASLTPTNRALFDGRALVTASALLDLVSEPWVRTLAAQCALHGSAVLFALTYDGRIDCSPADQDDGAIVGFVNQHQRTDKGFGPALGPDASACAERCFDALGYRVQRARSDWVLPPGTEALQRPLIDGWAQAATGIAPSEAALVEAWRVRRQAHVDAGRSHIIVGHEDLVAWVRLPA